MTTRRDIYIEHICSPQVLGYNRGSDITEGDITKVRVYIDYLKNVGGIWVLQNHKWGE